MSRPVKMAEQNTTSHAYYRSSDLSLPFRVKVGGLEARQLCGRPVQENGSSAWDLYVTTQVFSEGRPLSLPEQTAHRALVGRAQVRPPAARAARPRLMCAVERVAIAAHHH